MRLLEIVRGKESSSAVIATSMALAKRLGKVGVLVGNCRGFVGNRMFHCYQREAQFLLEEGASVDDFLEWFPGVAREQVLAVLNVAEKSLLSA